jgi:hypothetical protein
MIDQHTPIYLLVPGESNERVLYPGRVLATPDLGNALIGFDRAIAPPAGSDTSIFFEQRGKFFQQPGTIVARNDADANGPAVAGSACRQTIAFRSEGEPMSAESRGSYRVSVIGLELNARVENDRKCKLVDISPEGIGLITNKSHLLGTAVRVTLDYADHRLEGRARVQTVRPLPNGTFRCGLLVPSTEDETRRTLQKITATLQRAQLRNLRKSA